MTHDPAELRNHKQLEHCKGHYLNVEISDRTLTASLSFISGRASAFCCEGLIFIDARWSFSTEAWLHHPRIYCEILWTFSQICAASSLFTHSGVYLVPVEALSNWITHGNSSTRSAQYSAKDRLCHANALWVRMFHALTWTNVGLSLYLWVHYTFLQLEDPKKKEAR